MIKITSARQAEDLKGTIPDIVIHRMQQFEGDDGNYDPDIHGYLLWLEEGDDIATLTEWQPFEHVEQHLESGQRIYEIVVAIDTDKVIVIFTNNALISAELEAAP